MTSRAYSGNTDDLKAAGLPTNTKFYNAGYMARPMTGQWYLSGAIPAAYRAKHLLSTEYVIAFPHDRTQA